MGWLVAAQPKFDEPVDDSGERNEDLGEPEGSGAEAVPSTELRFVPAEGSGEQGPDRNEDAAVVLARDVVSTALAVPRTMRDPRIALLRAGGASADLAEVLQVDLIALTAESSLNEVRQDLQRHLDSLWEDRELLSDQVSRLARHANFLFDILNETEVPRPLLVAQLVSARALVNSVARERDRVSQEIRFTEEAIAYCEQRSQLLATEVSEELSNELEAATSEIAAERERLEQETEITDAVAARAREADERARQERGQAGAQASAVAARWEAIGPALESLTEARRVELASIEEINARREQFAAIQVERSGRLATILDEPDRDSRQRAADEFLSMLIEERAAVRLTASDRRATMRELQAAVERAADVVATGEREIAAIGDGTSDSQQAADLAELARAELDIPLGALALAELRATNAASRWRLNESQIHFYARAIDRLVPHLSPERRRVLFAMNADNLREARTNLQERIIGVRLALRELRDPENVVERTGRDGGLQRALAQLGGILLILLSVRAIPRRRDALVIRLIALRQRPRFRRLGTHVLKAGELLHESIEELTLLLGVEAAFWVAPSTPSVQLLLTCLWWGAFYRAVVKIASVIALPRDVRSIVLIGDPPDETRIGVDIVAWNADTGRLVVRSVKAIFGYLVTARIGLAAIRFLFGPGFVYYWCQVLVIGGLVALGYAIAWYWRKAIVEEFCLRVGDRADALADWLGRHQARWYSVVVVVLLGAYLLTVWLATVVARWVSGRRLGQLVTNFAMRKRLERAADGPAATARPLPLPAEYLRVFRDKPVDVGLSHVRCAPLKGEVCVGSKELAAFEPERSVELLAGISHDLVSEPPSSAPGDEAAARRAPCVTMPKDAAVPKSDGRADVLVERPAELRMLRAAYDGWCVEQGHGTVAIIGDPGSGKTTFGLAAAKEFESLGETVLSTTIRQRLTSREAVHEWLVDNLGLTLSGPPSRSTIVDALGAGTKKVVVVDRCEKLFLRTVGGFDGIDEFLDVTTLTNHRVFWLLTFDRFPWDYLHRVRDRRGFFRDVVRLRPFDDEQIQAMIERRNAAVGIYPNFDRLTGSEERSDQFYEVVRTSSGYYRLLAEYSRGNLRVALHFWLESLAVEEDGLIHVSLFKRPDAKQLRALSDEVLFALTAIAQHRALSVDELAEVLDLEPGEVEVTVNLLRETGYVQQARSERLRIAVRMFFPVLNRLREENFLHLD